MAAPSSWPRQASGWTARPASPVDEQLFDRDLAGFGIDRDLGAAPADLPEHAGRLKRRGVAVLCLVEALADEFPSGAAEMAHDHRGERMGLVAPADFPVLQIQFFRRAVQHFRPRKSRIWRRAARAARSTAWPITEIAELALVPWSKGEWSVSTGM